MKICIMAQEEPVCFSPFLREIIRERKEDVALIIMAGSRGAGDHPKTLKEKWELILVRWFLWEFHGLCKIFTIYFQSFLIRTLGLIGTSWDKRSVRGIAKRYRIPVHDTNTVNSPEVIQLLKEKEIDVMINQGEILLKDEILSIPKIGIINRHASLLPHFRGRVGSFWSHMHEPPEYGVTIHFVDQDIDSGPIITQKQFNLDCRWSYLKIISRLFKESVPLTLEALKKLESPEFVPLNNDHQSTQPYLFPKLEDLKKYHSIMKKRRHQK